MLKQAGVSLSLLLFVSGAVAHEVWIEPESPGVVRIYLGEPDEPVPAEGDAELHRLKAPTLVTGTSGAAPAQFTRRTQYLEAKVGGDGDVRLQDAQIFEPEVLAGGAVARRIYYARAGRTETRSVLDMEIVPVAANADAFRVLHKGKAVANARVLVTGPDRWAKVFRSDGEGVITVPTPWSGTYLLTVRHTVREPVAVAGAEASRVTHVSTLTFVEP